MRIVDKTRKDYYDCIQRFGMDDGVHYIRTERSAYLDVPAARVTVNCSFYHNLIYHYCEAIHILFCGKLYNAVIVYHGVTWDVFYSAEQLRTQFPNIPIEAARKGVWGTVPLEYVFTQVNTFDGLDFSAEIAIIARNRFDYKTKELTVRYNALLKPFQFYKVYDSYTAYQLLAAFIGNKAQPEPVMLQVSDKIKAIKAGHGDKYSFRKCKG